MEEIPELEFHGEAEPHWCSEISRWVLPVALTVGVPEKGPIPETTNWHLLISGAYPAGPVEVYPSKEGGITQTFRHQIFNGPGSDTRPWRSGKICPETPTAVLHHLGSSQEPQTAAFKLHWFVRRTVSWIELASRGGLATNDDPFELPHYPKRSRIRLAFDESPEAFRVWRETDASCGYARLLRLPGDGHQAVIRSFEDKTGRKIISTTWGRLAEEEGEEEPLAAWIRSPEVVALEPWQAPSTCSELASALKRQGLDLWRTLRGLLPRLRDDGPVTRDGRPHHLLIGFPIPDRIGGLEVRMHWLPIQFPPLSTGRKLPPGFRDNELGRWQQDKKSIFLGWNPLPWGTSESWASDEIGSRGYLPAEIRTRKAVLLGAGALGSVVAELLVRAGLTDLTIFDADSLEAGNLVRHTLLLDELDQKKSLRLAERLNKTSPHANVEGLAERFPPTAESEDAQRACAEADLVIDCTADDDVLHHLRDFAWKEDCLVTSVALNLGATRLYCFATQAKPFPSETYLDVIEPWIRDDRKEKSQDLDDLPREGVGCWHPIFPARIDDVWMMAGPATKFLVHALQEPPAESRFAVYECLMDEDGTFRGIHRREEPPGSEEVSS